MFVLFFLTTYKLVRPSHFNAIKLLFVLHEKEEKKKQNRVTDITLNFLPRTRITFMAFSRIHCHLNLPFPSDAPRIPSSSLSTLTPSLFTTTTKAIKLHIFIYFIINLVTLFCYLYPIPSFFLLSLFCLIKLILINLIIYIYCVFSYSEPFFNC